MTGPAGWEVSAIRCHPREHLLAKVYQRPDGRLFAPHVNLDATTPQIVFCRRCNENYRVDPAQVHRDAMEKRSSAACRIR